MQQILYFLKKFRFFLLFVFLEFIALFLTIQHHSFHKSKFINSSNTITGGIYNKANSIKEFFYLKSENKRLVEENTKLLNLINIHKTDFNLETFSVVDSIKYFQKYQYSFAKIINNNYTKPDNFLTIDKGTNHGVEPDLGIVNSKGVIGVVKNVSKNNATVLSILNRNSKINVRLKNSNHFGTIIWNGKNHNTIQLIDIPRQAIFKVGDTIITGGKSAIFPEGIRVGTIKDFLFKNNKYQEINILLFNDMSALGYIQIVKNYLKNEQVTLERNTINE